MGGCISTTKNNNNQRSEKSNINKNKVYQITKGLVQENSMARSAVFRDIVNIEKAASYYDIEAGKDVSYAVTDSSRQRLNNLQMNQECDVNLVNVKFGSRERNRKIVVKCTTRSSGSY